ncbi:hypothetical protein [Nitrosopumilus sp.]|uniref:hypothetical protein n=1 Tax=Nitrosopumilus sp. TaxID=2024843 RepID=UPI00247C0DBB|nr:hypothetical protein [Nitrosopumilus sp.]MCV0430928.1 hypothetical protein [Nitrosopumilus sp.]
MDKKLLGVIIGIGVIIGVTSLVLATINSEIVLPQETNEKIGLVINSPTQSVSLSQLDQIYADSSSTGIGRSNVYLFWNIVEPQRGEFDWQQSDILMGLNEKNNLKVTLFFSVINGNSLGPFPDWIGKPPINSIGEDRLVSVLDAILSRYHIVDSVIISGETESQFRYSEQNIPVYQELFSNVYDKLKEKHPDVKFGNSFALHQILNKDLGHIVDELAVGDFVAFSYFPVDNLNDIVKTPFEAKQDLKKAFDIVPNKKIAFFEVSWSSSDFVGGNTTSQKLFLEEMFDFYSENESEIEFFTWYRYSDRPEGTCVTEQQEIGDESISVGGGSGLGSSEFTIQRLNHYICNAGLVEIDGTVKPAWDEFKKQIEMIN